MSKRKKDSAEAESLNEARYAATQIPLAVSVLLPERFTGFPVLHLRHPGDPGFSRVSSAHSPLYLRVLLLRSPETGVSWAFPMTVSLYTKERAESIAFRCFSCIFHVLDTDHLLRWFNREGMPKPLSQMRCTLNFDVIVYQKKLFIAKKIWYIFRGSKFRE